MPGTPHRAHGFTLMEVMIALMIFGLLAATLQQVASGYMNNYRRIESQTMASWIAQNRLTEMRLQDQMPATGESDDEVEFGGHEWEVETAVSDTEDPAIRRVEMTLYRVDQRGDPVQQLVFTGFLGQRNR
ncbi:type II secretion system minor pseudopilin GspI [Vreelandella utahensis]|uniref:type II secretion system minor pseudopilin GspI n=1 Tax=Vreelandella halophila TaxID=86177 RepID=UPI0015C3671E|nr:type II secretion system minor pseudopilin GspI [Halomonas utahensis]